MRLSLTICCVLFAAIVWSGENPAPLDSSKLQIGWLTKDGAFPKDFGPSASFPRITLDKISLKNISVEDKKAFLSLSGRVDDAYEGILPEPHLKELLLRRDGAIRGTLPLEAVKDAATELAPYARHFTFAGKIQIEIDEKEIVYALETQPNLMCLEGRIDIALSADADKAFAPTAIEATPAESETAWTPFTLLIRAPAGTDENALYALADWKHFGRKVTLMKRPDQTDAGKSGHVDFVAAGADGKMMVLIQPFDVRPPDQGFGNAKGPAERIYLGEIEVQEKKEAGGKKRKMLLRAIVHDIAQKDGIKDSLKVVVKHNGIDWDCTFPDIPGDAAGEFLPRGNFTASWQSIEPREFEGTVKLCEQQIPAGNFGGIRK